MSPSSDTEIDPNLLVPAGCAFSGTSSSRRTLYSPNGTILTSRSYVPLRGQEQKAIIDLLEGKVQVDHNIQSAMAGDTGLSSDSEVLAAALGAPARRVLLRAEEVGPSSGWKDGHLSAKYGFLPPNPSASPIALGLTPGRVWSDLCERLPAVVARGKIRDEVKSVPLVLGTPEVIPDAALWAATVALGILASAYRYEERNNGYEGISFTIDLAAKEDIDNEPETKGLPTNLAIPLRQINLRIGRPLPHLSTFDITIYNYRIRDPTSVYPYLERRENMDVRWPMFNDLAEHATCLAMAEVHGCCTPIIDLIATSQENVMMRDDQALLRTLVKIKECVDQLSHVFHKMSVNPSAGENFANPVVWGSRFIKWTAPLSSRVPAMSGLALPLFLVMDVFLGRSKYDSFLGVEALHLRSWSPMNIRAFIAAIESVYRVPDYVEASGDPCLKGVLHGIVEAYAGERGFMGTHRYKVYGFLELVSKTGRTETNGNSSAGDKTGRPWRESHRTLSESMTERLNRYHKNVTVEPQEMRGTFEECRFSSRILRRDSIDRDQTRTTGLVTLDIKNSGLTFRPGDRLAVMPFNSSSEVDKCMSALGLKELLTMNISLDAQPEWKRFANHLAAVSHNTFSGNLTVHDVLLRCHLAPLTQEVVMRLYNKLAKSSKIVKRVLDSEFWPVSGSLGDLLHLALAETHHDLWSETFNTSQLSWLLDLIPVEVPRTYSIASFSAKLLPSTVGLTVGRSSFKFSPILNPAQDKWGHGVSSGFLNPDPSIDQVRQDTIGEEPVLIGISRPLNFQLPVNDSNPIVMFAGGSGIAPFRGFWQARVAQGNGRNILFLGVQSRNKLLHEKELVHLVHSGKMELHVAFSRDKNGLEYNPSTKAMTEKITEPRYINTLIVEHGHTVCDMLMPKKAGGRGGYLYVCGSVSFYETVTLGLRQAMYNSRNVTKLQAEELIAIAFAERRFMLDIFMTPQSMSLKQESISLAQLARNTGHKAESRMWIGVHGSVYDITDFLPLHPGGSFIAAASGGIDASQTFDDLAHTNNPEVSSLLTKYFIGHLAPKPTLISESSDIANMYDMWSQYLRVSVELLTTLGLEVQDLLENSTLWVSSGMLDAGGIRKFYQFQSRLLKSGISVLFGAKLQEMYLYISYFIVNNGTSAVQIPDVLGTVERAQMSSAAASINREVAQIGRWVCNNHEVQYHEKSLLRYAKAVTNIDLAFLESIRDDCALGIEAFDSTDLKTTTGNKNQAQLANYLLSMLQKLASRLDSFYVTLAKEVLLQPDRELNPARTRWNILRSKIHDGSFFVLCQLLELGSASNNYRSWQQILQHLDFQDVIARARNNVKVETDANRKEELRNGGKTMRLADSYIRRAESSDSSSFEEQIRKETIERMAKFIDGNANRMGQMDQMESMTIPALA
ncbi:hypothetical protein V498_02205 [Pseudogymnoascus sp. VKM F-4517 (FW-2822)]|nr:hypothetical protein V498_02205 [Pseudogymnoascus sp. VKM F-4517 (FW-2822)]